MASSNDDYQYPPLLKSYKIPQRDQHQFERFGKLRDFLEIAEHKFRNENGKQYVAVRNFPEADFNYFNKRKKYLPPLRYLYDEVEKVMIVNWRRVLIMNCRF